MQQREWEPLQRRVCAGSELSELYDSKRHDKLQLIADWLQLIAD